MDVPDPIPGGPAAPARRSAMLLLAVLAIAFILPIGYGVYLVSQRGGPSSSPGPATARPTAPAPPPGVIAHPGPTFPSALPSVPVDAHAFHVDCENGDDEASGDSPTTAWKTLARASRAALAPGDEVLLLAGCRWPGPLRADWQGTPDRYVTVSTYGTGERPIIADAPDEEVEVSGAYVVIEGLALRTDPPTHDAGCDDAPAGRIVGVRLVAESHHIIVRDIDARGFFSAIRIERGSSSNRILDNELHDNDMKSDDPDSDAGAIGVDVQGDDNEIAGNRISGSDTCSRWFAGRDGSAVSIFGGRRNLVHNNVTWDNNGFIEIGDTRTEDTIVAYNLDTSTLPNGTYLVNHGVGTKYGPVTRTTVVNNTAYLTGRNSFGVQCTGGCPPSVLSFRDNIVWTEDRIGFSESPFDEAGNIFWRSTGQPVIYFQLDPSTRVVDPGFVDVATGDLSLLPTSPAIDGASTLAASLGLQHDLFGTVVPQGLGPDIGAYEHLP